MLNHAVLMGRLTRDPELRYTGNNTPVVSFSIAVDRDIADRDGNRTTDFFDVTAWRSTAEFVSKYFRKGSLVAVTGRLQNREWTDRDGNKRRGMEVVADNVYFAEPKKSAADKDDKDIGSSKAPPFTEIGDEDGELPF